MSTASESLNRVLRRELTAVNQQFMHVLALRAWGDVETAERIMQVDYVDFPNAMRIIDHLVESDLPVVLPPDPFTPGTGLKSILSAEQVVERRLSEAIEAASGMDERGRALVSAAKAPREAYGAWLADRLRGAGIDEPVGAPAFVQAGGEIADVLGHLITMIEQPLVHAFVHWHGGERPNADASWASSGAAMVQLTAFVHLFAARKTIPAPGAVPAPRIARRPAEALDFDRRLAEQCAEVAAKAALTGEKTGATALCRKIADYCHDLARWRPGRAHPAAGSNPAAFASFEATLMRFVR